jgi:hypothetical protein
MIPERDWGKWRPNMEESNRLQYPILEISIGGEIVDKRPSRFTLTTAQGFPAVMANLVYPADTIMSAIGESVIIWLVGHEDKNILFTGEIYDAKRRRRVL